MTHTELSPLAMRAIRRSGWDIVNPCIPTEHINRFAAAVETLVLADVYGDVSVPSPQRTSESPVAVLAERVDGLSRRLIALERGVVMRAD